MTPEEAREAINLSSDAAELDRQDAEERHMARVAKIRAKCEHGWEQLQCGKFLCRGCWMWCDAPGLKPRTHA